MSVAQPQPQLDALSRRLTALLCLTIVVASIWGLHRITAGFEVWTFEGRRQLQVHSGVLQASPVVLRTAPRPAHTLWHEGAARPAAYLVDFIYTRCPGICRALGSEFQQMQLALATAPVPGDVHLVSISIDVEHDDPAQLTRFAAGLASDPAWWTFAVPATPDDARQLLRSLGVVAIPDGEGGFVHNGAIHLLDERGRLRGLFELEQWPQALAAARLRADPELAGPSVAAR